MPSDGIMHVGRDTSRGTKEKGYVEITVGSGTAEVVAPLGFAADYRAKPSASSRAGAKYHTASGNIIANQGEKRVMLKTECGELRAITLQSVDVTKPCASAGHITAHGQRVVLGDEDAYIAHTATGSKVPLTKRGSVFVM